MKVSGKRTNRIWAFVLCIMLVGGLVCPIQSVQAGSLTATEKTQSGQNQSVEQTKVSDYYDRVAYYYYIRQYADAVMPDEETRVELEPVDKYSDDICYSTYTDFEGSKEGLRMGDADGQVTFKVKIPKSGLYNIALTYMALAESNISISVGVLIDHQLPFSEAATCVLSRTYRNGEIRQDEEGNDIRPLSEQLQVWRTQYLRDQSGVNGELYFYFEKGEHFISIVTEESPFLLEAMTIEQKPYELSYSDYISLHKQSGHESTTGIKEVVQAESFAMQSDSTLWPIQDRTSPLMEPFDYNVTKLNVAGGSQWKTPGQWISWEIEVPEDGFYNIGIKYRQNYLEGLYSSRRILIDGEVPFEELNNVRFEYDSQWQMKEFGNEYNEPYQIYLTAGKHTLTMENVVGDLRETLDVLQTAIDNLNELYLSVIMITGTEPDPYRDYYLGKNFPNLSEQLKQNADIMFGEAERLIEEAGARGSEAAFFENIAYDLVSYSENVEDLAHKGRVEDLKTNITSLSTKITELGEQALDIDYFVIASPNTEMPRVTMNLNEWISYQMNSFVASFGGSKPEQQVENQKVKVWLIASGVTTVSTSSAAASATSGAGNDQYLILLDMIEDMFTPETGIEVELELVKGSLVEAIVSGQGPDVAIGINADTVVNLALRGALAELDDFEGFEELEAEHIEGSFTPFTLEGRTYGIANMNAFNMMFVRLDIFERLGLEVPTTWDEMYDVTQVLQRNNMTLGTVPGFATLLYQKGGSYFDEGRTKVLFDEEVAIDAFTQYTEFHTKYSYPITYDFLNRFRSGETPIAIQSYSMYNTLKYSAQEIDGLWGMYTIPGTVREDGTVNYTQADAGGTGTVIFAKNNNAEAAWKFVEWWSGKEAQARYGNDLESVMGTAARYAAVNVEAFQELNWSSEEQEIIMKQMENMEYIPIVPGNYYVSRGINNTFRGVVYDDKNVRELLLKWTDKINQEITRKREEFYLNN